LKNCKSFFEIYGGQAAFFCVKGAEMLCFSVAKHLKPRQKPAIICKVEKNLQKIIEIKEKR
jgi:hypothetical protein